jgi:hypothetical protein
LEKQDTADLQNTVDLLKRDALPKVIPVSFVMIAESRCGLPLL